MPSLFPFLSPSGGFLSDPVLLASCDVDLSGAEGRTSDAEDLLYKLMYKNCNWGGTLSDLCTLFTSKAGVSNSIGGGPDSGQSPAEFRFNPN